MTKIFIDGSAGTTGLRIRERLASRKDLTLLTLPEEKRKDVTARKEIMNLADVVFLCLPDTASIEAVSLVDNPNVAVIDTSTAHRTNDFWTYGLPELGGQKQKIASSKRIANPGCHASGFIALVAPLIKAGIIKDDIKLSCFSVTGYTGGGKKMIAEYEDENRNSLLDAPRQYALGQAHKHLPEMVKVCGLKTPPIFCPIVADFDCGMEVTVPLFKEDVTGSIDDVKKAYKTAYAKGLIKYTEESEDGLLSANALRGKDSMTVGVYGNGERILLVSRFDNLGKGASGAAIQNMNILLGVDETLGLEL